MTIHRSAMGRQIDMAQIIAKNEKVRAVGNMNVNARGDTIDSEGRVVVPVTKKVGSAYNQTVANRGLSNEINAEIQRRHTRAEQPVVDTQPVVEPEESLLAEELELEDDAEATEIEALKAAEMEALSGAKETKKSK